jgi:medium-chain acyl-[acyl-carrier-protein] hydrolase
MTQPVYRENFPLSTIHLDRFGRMKTSMILYFAQEVATAHCKILGCDWDEMAKKGLFWAVMRHNIQIHRLPKDGDTITVETWPMPTTKVCYPRSCAAFDENGQLLFQVHSLWILMDASSRAMVLPGKSGVTVDGILRGTELSAPPSLQPKPMAQSISRAVRYSDLDRNGHMNNVKYLDWIADLLCSDFHRENTPSSVSLCYVNEAREGDTLKLGWSQGEDNIVRVEVTEETTNRRIFGASVGY